MLRIHTRCHKCGSIADHHQERLFATFIDGSNLIQADDAGGPSNLPQNRHPERSASQIYRVVHRWARSRRTSRGAYSTHAVGTLSTTEAAPGGPATVQRFGTDLGM